MSDLLSGINSPIDLKKLDLDELPALCKEIRTYLLNTILNVGGHLASNLGVVELTVALHYVFDSPEDKLCWDVGHQSYIHKILTGRKNSLSTIRHLNGLSGFPQNTESEHDHYNTGHAGTSISQALGEAFVRNKKEETFSVISIIGDASISTGMAFEALNHAGALGIPFLVILNDNKMSISPSVGAFHQMLSRIYEIRFYKNCSSKLFNIIFRLPFICTFFKKRLMTFVNNLSTKFYSTSLFESLGFKYLGPEDGHNVKKLVQTLQKLKNINFPTVLHLITQKGKGFSPAEDNPMKFHGLSKKNSQNTLIPLSEVVGGLLCVLRERSNKVVAITPAMQIGSGLVSFAEKYPESFLDVGIAEQHATTLSAAIAHAGFLPYLCIYSTFLQRSLDQLIHDICLMGLPVRIIIDRAGCVGEDGETHQGVYDLSFMYPLNILIFSTDDYRFLIAFLLSSESFSSPVAIRIPKKKIEIDIEKEINSIQNSLETIDIYKPKLIYRGTKVIIFLEGSLSSLAASLHKKILEISDLSVQIEAVFCLKPLNKLYISNALDSFLYVFIIEEHVKVNGFAYNFFNTFQKELKSKEFYSLGYSEEPLPHGNIMDVKSSVGMDTDSLATKIVSVL